MKKQFYLLCCLLSSLLSQAQYTYRPLLVPGRAWATCLQSFWGGAQSGGVVRSISDTATYISGNAYYQIDGKFLREDTIARKVWKYNVNTQTDELWFDFSLTVGDTMVVPQQYGSSSGSWIITSDSVYDNAPVYPINYRVLALKQRGSHYVVNLIEGIGFVTIGTPFYINSNGLEVSMRGLLAIDSNMASQVLPRSWFDGDENLLIEYVVPVPLSATTGFCPTISGLSKVDKNESFGVSPNPCNMGSIAVQLPLAWRKEKLSYSIVGVDGRLLQKVFAYAGGRVDVSGLNNGVYLIRLMHEGAFYTQKLVIQ